jgi:transposase-like protein
VSQLVLGVAMLGCGGAWVASYVPRAVRWLTRMPCPQCGKPKLALAAASHDGVTRFRCRLCCAEYYRHDGKLIGRAAFEAGARDPFPRARLR